MATESEKKTNDEICRDISALLDYADMTGLTGEGDRVYCANALAAEFGLAAFHDTPGALPSSRADLPDILGRLCDAAEERGLITPGTSARDRFDTRLMGHLTPRPSQVNAIFAEKLARSPVEATDYFYRTAIDSDYIRAYRISRDRRWSVASPYGDIDISINLSKPEKDPRDIAAARNAAQSGYPRCLLCHENVGYPGSLTAPARQTLRQVPLTLGGERWYMQYSPYVYYNEHCIVLSALHTPMSIRRGTFERMLDFVDILPHYFIGSNADLPIVGGSILTHDHMQGGRYTFPMERAPITHTFSFRGFPGVTGGIVAWPMSVIRLRGADTEELCLLADSLLTAWRGYSDAECGIFAVTDGVPHNTITPIARRRGSDFELDLVLRNNLTTEAHPMGVYHPHAHRHNIKKENIGLIEVMGLAVLPARLDGEMARLEQLILSGADAASDAACAKHAAWLAAFRDRYTFTPENTAGILREEIGRTFTGVLEDAGVYKTDEAGHTGLLRFAASAGAVI